MSARTQFTETEALLLALDMEDDDDTALLAYLDREFLAGELAKLQRGANLLSRACTDVGRRKQRRDGDLA